MEKIYKFTTYANPVLCVATILFIQLDNIHPLITGTSIVLFLLNFVGLIISAYNVRNKKELDERNIAGQIIAALEAGDYMNAYRINEQFKKGSRLGTAFSFYILGILSEKTKDDDTDIINKLDKLREHLFELKKD